VRPITPIKPSEAVVSSITDRVFDALLAEPQAKECPHVGHGCHLERCCSGLSRCITVAGGTPTCMAPADVIKRCLARSRNDTCQELTLCAGLEEECTFSGTRHAIATEQSHYVGACGFDVALHGGLTCLYGVGVSQAAALVGCGALSEMRTTRSA
jgi:hypothetical protein